MSVDTEVRSERTPLAPKKDLKRRVRAYVSTHISLIAIIGFAVALVIFFSVATDGFLTSNNILNLLRQTAPLLICAVGMTFVITIAGIDLSVGSGVAVIGCVLAFTLANGISEPLALLITLVAALAIGAVQGYFTAYQKVFAFIVTLAGLYILRGVSLVITQGYSIPLPADSFTMFLGNGELGGIPVSVLVAVVVVAIGGWLFSATPFGRYVVALGSNRESLRRTGVNVQALQFSVYVLSFVCVAIAGVILSARLGAGSSGAGLFFELQVITAVVLGGTNLFGGRGTIFGSVVGSLVLGIVLNGLVIMGVSHFYVQIVTGGILLIAVTFNARLDTKFQLNRR
jgi:simple sugar transport system permease protein